MKKIIIIALLFLFACTAELPPSPPDPSNVGVGSAIGGVQISPAVLPSWAASLMYTDVTPTFVKEGDLLRVTVSKEYLNASDKKFYAYAAMYVYNKDARVWERFNADTSSSGRIVKKWADGKAVFLIPVGSPRFSAGLNFLITYWCIDTGLRDGQGFKIWNCNGRKWGLGAFEMQGAGFPNILIERDIGANKYINSSRRATSEGAEYAAFYSEQNVTTSVKVTQLNNFSAYKQSLSSNLPVVEALWTPISNVCGFYQNELKRFTWLSGSNLIIVQTFGSSLDQSKVSAYNLRYPSNCGLLDELRRNVSGASVCGDGIKDAVEECDGRNDTACPGLCKPDCGCSLPGTANTGVCGDFKIQPPNSQSVFETCEPPEKRDVLGNLVSGSPCYLRDPAGAILQKGHCDSACSCVSGIVNFTDCGNGRCAANETVSSCPVDCPPESIPPNITVITPSQNQIFNTTIVVYTVLASDDSGVASCTASSDNGPKEIMTGIGGVWKLTKLFVSGNHSVRFECADQRLNAGNASRSFAVLSPLLFGSYNVTVLDQQNNTLDGARVEIFKNSNLVGMQNTVNGRALFSGLRYGEYDVSVAKPGFLPASVQISLIVPYLETFVYLTPIAPPPIITVSGNQTCVVPIINQGLVSVVSRNADDFCTGFEDFEHDLVIPPVFIDNTSSVPNGVPNLRPHGEFDSQKRNLTCTIPCNVVVKRFCLDDLGFTGAHYTANLVKNYACSGSP